MNPSQILPKQNNIAFRIKQRFLRSWLSSSSPLSRRIGRPRLADPPNGHEGRGRQQTPTPQCSLARQGQSGHLCFASRPLQLSRYAPYQRTWKAFSHDAQRIRLPPVKRRVPSYPIPHEPEKQKSYPSMRMPSIAISATAYTRQTANQQINILDLVLNASAFSGTSLRVLLKKVKYPSLSTIFLE